MPLERGFVHDDLAGPQDFWGQRHVLLRVQHDQVDLFRPENIAQVLDQLELGIACIPRAGQPDRDIRVAQGASLAPGKPPKKIGE